MMAKFAQDDGGDWGHDNDRSNKGVAGNERINNKNCIMAHKTQIQRRSLLADQQILCTHSWSKPTLAHMHELRNSYKYPYLSGTGYGRHKAGKSNHVRVGSSDLSLLAPAERSCRGASESAGSRRCVPK